MNELLNELRATLTQEGLSYRTCAGYVADIRKYVSSMGPEVPSEENWRFVRSSDIGCYLEGLSRRGASSATLRRARASIHKFYQIRVGRGELATNPADSVRFSSREEPGLSERQVLSVFRYLRLRSRQVAPRKAMADEIILYLLVFTGLRMKHISAIAPDSFVSRDGELMLNACPGLVIDGPIRGHVSTYLRRYGAHPGRLFPTPRITRELLQEIGSGLGITLDPRLLFRTHRHLRRYPERALSLLSRIEDIHE